jgi:hypothetical protein
VKTLSASIIGNLLDEKVESEDLIARRYDTESYIVADLQCVSDTRKQLLVDMGYNLETTSRWLPYNVTVMFNETLKRVTYVGKCKFDTNEKIERYCQPNPLRFGSTAYKGDEKYDLNDEAAQAVPAECVYVSHPRFFFSFKLTDIVITWLLWLDSATISTIIFLKVRYHQSRRPETKLPSLPNSTR